MNIEKIKNKDRKKIKKGIFLLPNLFTTGNLFAGCFSIFCAIDGNYQASAIAIFVAVFLDGLDGKVARATNAVSDFGKDYDSLCDLVSFGIAPAIFCRIKKRLTIFYPYGSGIEWVGEPGTVKKLSKINLENPFRRYIKKKQLDGIALAETLGSYSELGDEYTAEVQKIIKINSLDKFDYLEYKTAKI